MIPNSYKSAFEFLSGKNRKVVRGKKATEVLRVSDTCIALYYWSTPVVTWHSDGRTFLRTGGHKSVTTKRRINQAIAGKVWQRNFEWWYTAGPYHNPEPFREGMFA